ncbi:pre-rRNA-processing protein TSR2 homolog [Tiliqua scincoides]|uniref:pre-rRNA-processing protein TSR2 homolog n=1 Tax=Tiliqua scincoides TaxID=71010 RepID=UPI00346296BF
MATPKQEARGLFQKGVEAVLGSWPVLQIAVENGFGGTYSQEKAEWMVGAVEQYFQSNANLEQEEVEDFLAELMNNEFDTIIEDGSLVQVSQQLCLFFSQCQQGDREAVHEAIARLKQKAKAAKMAAAKSQPAEESSSEEEQEAEEEAMDCSAAPSMNGSQPSLSPPPGPDGGEDGWTLVKKKK